MAQLLVEQGPELYFTSEEMEKTRGDVSQARFAELCGWTQQYQCQLEMPRMKHRLTDMVKDGLARAGVKIQQVTC